MTRIWLMMNRKKGFTQADKNNIITFDQKEKKKCERETQAMMNQSSISPKPKPKQKTKIKIVKIHNHYTNLHTTNILNCPKNNKQTNKDTK